MAEFEPIELETSDQAPEVEKVHLFSIDGKKYYAVKSVPFNVTLRATRIMAQRGENDAMAYALVESLGQEGYDALCEFEELTEEQFEYICDYAREVVVGKGKASKGPNRPVRRSGAKR